LIHLTNPSCAPNKKGADSMFAPKLGAAKHRTQTQAKSRARSGASQSASSVLKIGGL